MQQFDFIYSEFLLYIYLLYYDYFFYLLLLLLLTLFWHKIPGNFDENNSSKQQKFREFLHFLHTKFREFLRKKATSRCFFSKKFREFLLF